MRMLIAVVVVAAAGRFALRRFHPPAPWRLQSPAGGIVRQGQERLRRGADLVGLYAYLAAMNRGLPDRHVLQSAYRSTSHGEQVVPFWGGPSDAMLAAERASEPAVAGRADG